MNDDRTTGASERPVRFGRETMRDVVPYPAERVPCDADLSDNTNLFGAPPAALRELRAAGVDEVARYPGIHAGRLRGALATYAGVRPEEIVTGCGSDDVIDSAMRAFAEPGESLAFTEPTFSMIPVFARVNGLVPTPVSFTAGYDIDPDALLATGARVIYICSPNNPTGCGVSRQAVEWVIERAPGLVIIDEAYAEFAGRGYLAEAPQLDRVLVTRTMSKAFGMAGLRIGYGAGAPALVREVEKARGPYKENAPGERAAAAALLEDVAWMRHHVTAAVESRERLAAALRTLGLAPLPSQANFILLPVPDATAVAARMGVRGVVVRAYPGLRGIGDAVRITVGPWPLMERALGALQAALVRVAPADDEEAHAE